jgi:hypothetical protein
MKGTASSRRGACQRPPNLVGSSAQVGRERFLQRKLTVCDLRRCVVGLAGAVEPLVQICKPTRPGRAPRHRPRSGRHRRALRHGAECGHHPPGASVVGRPPAADQRRVGDVVKDHQP